MSNFFDATRPLKIIHNYMKSRHYVLASRRRGVLDEEANLVLLYGEELRQGVYMMTNRILAELRYSAEDLPTSSLDALRGLVVVTATGADELPPTLVTIFKKYSANGALRTPFRRDPYGQRCLLRRHADRFSRRPGR